MKQITFHVRLLDTQAPRPFEAINNAVRALHRASLASRPDQPALAGDLRDEDGIIIGSFTAEVFQ